MEDVRLGKARQLLLERATSALAELVDEDPPEALVNSELRNRAESLVISLQAQGIALEQYLAATGQDQVTLIEGLKSAATRAVKVDLALRAVADAEGIEVNDDDLEAEYERIAVRVNQKPNQVRKAYERNDAVSGLRGELRKRKALEWLLRHVEIVDAEGRPSTASCCCRPTRSWWCPTRSTPPATRTTTTTTTPVTTTTTPVTTTTTTTPRPTKRRTPDGARLQLPRPHGGRADEPGRAGLRPLLAGCSRRTSSSWARRSTTRSPTWSAPS